MIVALGALALGILGAFGLLGYPARSLPESWPRQATTCIRQLSLLVGLMAWVWAGFLVAAIRSSQRLRVVVRVSSLGFLALGGLSAWQSLAVFRGTDGGAPLHAALLGAAASACLIYGVLLIIVSRRK